jgi:hypothetical protein
MSVLTKLMQEFNPQRFMLMVHDMRERERERERERQT